jgi:hypothetical protein
MTGNDDGRQWTGRGSWPIGEPRVTIARSTTAGAVPLRMQTRAMGDCMGAALTLLALAASSLVATQDECDVVWIPDELPALAEVLDSTMLMAALPEFADSIEQSVLLTVRFAPELDHRRVDVIGTEAPIETAGALRAAIETLLHDRDVLDPWGVRIRIMLGASPWVNVETSGYCPPHPERPISPFRVRYIDLSSEQDIRDLMQRGNIRVRVEVDVFGRVAHADLVRQSGSRIWNDMVLNDAWEYRYVPAVLDGVVVQGTFEYDVRFRPPRDT